MGSGLCKLREDDLDQVEAKKAKPAPRESLYFLDAVSHPSELEYFQKSFRGSCYFEALQEEQSAEDDQYVFRYAPAQIPDPHKRGSVVIDDVGAKPRRRASEVIVEKFMRQSRRVHAEGYPGDLTPTELQACLEFRRQLKVKDPAYAEMVYALGSVEEEAYALCRFMRARNFDVDDVFAMLDECVDLWKEAAARGFPETTEKAIGQPRCVFYPQFPILPYGLAQNGTFVVYNKVGKMSVDGLECLVDLNELCNYIWYSYLAETIENLKQLQEENPDVVLRCEQLAVVDFLGLSSSQVTQKAVDTLKRMFEPTSCFPETLNKCIILNAPGFFSFIWRIVKVFLHPRTTQKVEIFSSHEKGSTRLRELVASKFVPSDYGGQAPSIEEIAQNRFCESGHRQIQGLLSSCAGRAAEWNFSLNEREKIVSVTIYTRSKKAQAAVRFNTQVVGEVSLENIGDEENKPYSVVVTSNLEGQGEYDINIESESRAKENFLVVVDVLK